MPAVGTLMSGFFYSENPPDAMPHVCLTDGPGGVAVERSIYAVGVDVSICLVYALKTSTAV